MVIEFIELKDFEYNYEYLSDLGIFQLKTNFSGDVYDMFKLKEGDFLLIRSRIVKVMEIHFTYHKILNKTEYIIYLKPETEKGHITKITLK